MSIGNSIFVILIAMPCLVFICYKIFYGEDSEEKETFAKLLAGLVIIGVVIALFDAMDRLIWKGKFQTLKVIANIILSLGFWFLFSQRKKQEK